MKTFIVALISSLILMAILLSIGALQHNWGLSDHWMLILGAVCCLIALVCTGGVPGRVGRGGAGMDRRERNVFLRTSGFLFTLGLPNLMVAIVMYYHLH